MIIFISSMSELPPSVDESACCEAIVIARIPWTAEKARFCSLIINYFTSFGHCPWGCFTRLLVVAGAFCLWCKCCNAVATGSRCHPLCHPRMAAFQAFICSLRAALLPQCQGILLAMGLSLCLSPMGAWNLFFSLPGFGRWMHSFLLAAMTCIYTECTYSSLIPVFATRVQCTYVYQSVAYPLYMFTFLWHHLYMLLHWCNWLCEATCRAFGLLSCDSCGTTVHWTAPSRLCT